jgi:biopolymer transport protein ExbD
MAFSTAGGGPSRPEMNVTPMIDVLLVLIIIFMVVNQSMLQTGVDAQIPQPPTKDSPQPQPERTVVIQVAWGPDGHTPVYKINQEEVSTEQLEPRLHDIFKMRAERIAFVKGDNDVDFEPVAQVIAMAREAGIDRVGLLTNQ